MSCNCDNFWGNDASCHSNFPMICLPLPFICTKPSRWCECEIPCGQPRPEPCPPRPCPPPCPPEQCPCPPCPPKPCPPQPCPPCPPEPCNMVCADVDCQPKVLTCNLFSEFRIPRHRCVKRVCTELTDWYWHNCCLVICYKVIVCYINCCGMMCEYTKCIRTSCADAKQGNCCDPTVTIAGALEFELCGCCLKTKLPVQISC